MFRIEFTIRKKKRNVCWRKLLKKLNMVPLEDTQTNKTLYLYSNAKEVKDEQI